MIVMPGMQWQVGEWIATGLALGISDGKVVRRSQEHALVGHAGEDLNEGDTVELRHDGMVWRAAGEDRGRIHVSISIRFTIDGKRLTSQEIRSAVAAELRLEPSELMITEVQSTDDMTGTIRYRGVAIILRP